MSIKLLDLSLDENDIANQVVATAIFALVTGVFYLLIKFIKIIINKLGIKYSSRSSISYIINLIKSVFNFFSDPAVRIIFLTIISAYLFYLSKSIIGLALSVVMFYIGLSFYTDLKRKKSGKEPLLLDTFKNLDNWRTVSGNPEVDTNLGNPAPSVILSTSRGQNSTMELNELDFSDGVIEADIYLEPNSLINIVFRANFSENKYYMARFDSRNGNFNAFLKNEGTDWFIIAKSNRNTRHSDWQTIRVVISGDTFKMYDEKGLVITVIDTEYSEGSIGVFNEVASAHLDNISIGN